MKLRMGLINMAKPLNSESDVTGTDYCHNCKNWNKDKTCKMRSSDGPIHKPIHCSYFETKQTIVMVESENDENKKKNQSDEAADMGIEHTTLFHDQYKEPYAVIEVGSHKEIHAIKSKFFRRWFVKLIYDVNNKVPSLATCAAALKILEAKACFEGPRNELYNRVAWHNGALYYDLTNDKWEAVKIISGGWVVVAEPPILFRRYNHQQAQVMPEHNGDFNELLEFFNIKREDDKKLLQIYTPTCLIPDIPHPIPTFHGPQGSSKSTAAKVIRKLIDPSVVELLSFPKDYTELVQNLSHHYCSYFDNVGTLPKWLSDALCKACTGDGFSKRELYTDDDDIIYSFRRCAGLNAINIPGTAPDLLDRSMLCFFGRIEKKDRIPEKMFWKKFEEQRPYLLGAMFDVLSKAIDIKEGLNLKELPRMADFAEWSEAISQALGNKPGYFMDIYFRNIEIQNVEALQAHAIAPAIMHLMQDREKWEGTMAELLKTLEEAADVLKLNKIARSWPKAPNALSRRLKEVESNLKDIGITMTTWPKPQSNVQMVTLVKEVEEKPPLSPPISESTGDGLYNKDRSGDSEDSGDICPTLKQKQEGLDMLEEDVIGQGDCREDGKIIHHKCSICGQTPCTKWSRIGKPLCKDCEEAVQ